MLTRVHHYSPQPNLNIFQKLSKKLSTFCAIVTFVFREVSVLFVFREFFSQKNLCYFARFTEPNPERKYSRLLRNNYCMRYNVHCTCYYYYISSVSRGLHLDRLGLRNVQPHDLNTDHLWLFRDGSTAIFSCSFICILCFRGVFRYVNSSSLFANIFPKR